MLHISFNAEELTENEVKGLSAFIQALAWKTVPNARERLKDFTTAVALTDPMAEIFMGQGDVPQPDPCALQELVDLFVQEPGVIPEPTPTPLEEPVKRKRRTKAEMEADAAATTVKLEEPKSAATEAFTHKLALLNDQMDAGKLSTEKRMEAVKAWQNRYAADPAKAMADIETALEQNSTFLDKLVKAEPLHAYTTDELRPMLQDYTETRSMQDGLDLLSAFECARVSDVTKLTVEKQAEFVGRLRG